MVSRAALTPALVNLTFDQLAVGERSGPVMLPQPEGNQVFAIKKPPIAQRLFLI